MTNYTKIALICCALLGACQYVAPDPCAVGGSVLRQPGGQVDMDCQECGQSPCPPPIAETGGEEAIFEILTCPKNDKSYCWAGDLSDPVIQQLGFDLDAVVKVQRDECTTQSTTPFDCTRTYTRDLAFPDAPAFCYPCEATMPDAIPLPDVGFLYQDKWAICGLGPLSYGAYSASVGDNWWAFMTCPFGGVLRLCEPVQIWHAGQPPGIEWNCTCPEHTDGECQDTAVCEYDKHPDPDGVPQWNYPHLCGHPLAAGDPLVSGPQVYGLEAWADGIVVDGDSVSLTIDMFLALDDGLANDDLSFDSGGAIAHCGPFSLCAHLGLGVGDMFVADQADIDTLADMRTTWVEVLRADGSTRVLEVSLSSR